MAVRNFEEYRAEVLEQLGATAEDLRNEPSWRAKVLEALGAEYTDEDTRNFERYRLKVLENLSGGGGGGSGDFSTAQVTIINTTEDADVDIYLPVVIDDEDYTGLMYDTYVSPGETRTITTVLYKGSNTAYLYDSQSLSVSVSGNVVYDHPNFDITGDCTITIS